MHRPASPTISAIHAIHEHSLRSTENPVLAMPDGVQAPSTVRRSSFEIRLVPARLPGGMEILADATPATL
jgi:hypothetical protein